MRSWIARTGLAVLWLAATAGIAFAVARATASPAEGTRAETIARPIPLDQRPVTTLQPHTIQPVVSGDGIVVADGDGYALEAPVSPRDRAYQLLTDPVGVKAMILGGPAGFDCPWLGLGQGEDRGVTMRCRIPPDIKVAPGLSGTMVLAMSPPKTVPSLPVTAVVGSAQTGQVVVVQPDGTTSVRQVSLGMADTFWVEITGGLSEGETVLQAPVQADFAMASR
jgi:hypothetical protein